MTGYFLQLAASTVFIAVLILWPAGTFIFPAGWVLLGILTIGGAAMIGWLGKYHPGLLRERMAFPIQRDQKPWDRVWLVLFIVAFYSWIAFTAWDAARTGFNAVPFWLQVLGGIGTLVCGAGTWWTFRENSFAAPVVKIQQGQEVIDTGPYAIVRHPMYTSALFLFTGTPLLLGSWLGLAMASLLILAIAWRAMREELTLRDELKGYEDYVKRVRYRLIPHIW